MSDILHSLLLASWETVYMVFVSSFVGMSVGLVLGVVLFLSQPGQIWQQRGWYNVLGFIVNVGRSVPFIILLISIIPLTRLLVGTSIGTTAAIVPLSLAAIPFYARVTESALAEVPAGLVEAAIAMGASSLQIIHKVLLPEALPSLIKGGTLTVISLVGYSAMAGVVGGGGLGELAINYGYQRFDVTVMLLTVIVLVVLVQLVQMIGDWLAGQRRLRPLLIACVSLWVASIGSQVVPAYAHHETVIRVGVMNGVQEKIMQVAQQVAKKEYDITLKIVTFDDYVLPNTALENRAIDANIFQHQPYLDAQMKDRGYNLVTIGKTFVYPMGFFSKRIHALQDLPAHALVALPNDPSNEARALLLLQKAGVIKLRDGVGVKADVRDIVANPKQLQFKTLAAAQLPRALDDADLVALTNDFVTPAGFKLSDALLHESRDSLYANIIVVAAQDKDKPALQTLVKVMHSQPVVAITKTVYPDGAAIPAFNAI